LDNVGPGQILLADRTYDSDALRQNLADRGAWANVKPISSRVNVPAFSLTSIVSATSSSASSTSSNISVQSRPASKNATPITSHSSNLPQPEFGCAL
jgi:hypothetical protein